MKIVFSLVFSSLAAMLIAGCGNEDSSPATTKKEGSTQDAFCKIISESRDEYFSEKEKDFYIDQETEFQRIYDQRTKELKEMLGAGVVSNWNGVISNISVSKGKGAFLQVDIDCDATLEPNDSLIIPIDSNLYHKLRKYTENSRINFSGNFIPPGTNNKNGEFPYKAFYGEQSFTQNGSMIEPEFLFKFSDFHN